MVKIELPSVTLCAAASVNVPATIAALRRSMAQVRFADCLMFTDASVEATDDLRVVQIPKLRSSADYSEFVVKQLAGHVSTSHCLIVQWDGFVLNADRWDPAFLDFDYIGAPWPQFKESRDVGNGGFSLRSHRLLNACQDPHFEMEGAEDVAICRLNRSLLERKHGIRFADRRLAGNFSYERAMPSGPTFGFHGIFNMIDAIGVHEFWQIYVGLDDRSTAYVDFGQIFRQLGAGPSSARMRARLVGDRVTSLFTG